MPGHLNITAEQLSWRAGEIEVPLDEGAVVAVEREVRHRRAQPGDVLVQLDSDGESFFLVLAQSDAARLTERLAPSVSARPGGVSARDGESEPSVADAQARFDAGPAPSTSAATCSPADSWASPAAPDTDGWQGPPPRTFGSPTDTAAGLLVRLAPYAVRWVPDHGWASSNKPEGAAAPALAGVLMRAFAVPALLLSLLVQAAARGLRADGLDVRTAIVLGLALVVFVVGAVRLARALERHLALRDAALPPTRPALGTLTAAGDGRPLLLVADPAIVPAEPLLVALRTPLPHGVAARFASSGPLALHCRGDLEPGGTVIVAVAGPPTRNLVPDGPAWAPSEAELAELLGGD